MSVNYMQGGELVQVAGNTDAIPNGEKGKPGGVATLDENAKIPVDQLPEITALDVNAVPRYTKVFAGEGVGWYRIGNISLTSSFSFTLNVDREWSNGVPEGFSILIRCIHKTVNPPSHGLSFLQTSALSGNKHIDKIRIVINQKEGKGFLDLHYSSNLWNQIYVRIDNITQSQDAIDVDMESTVMDPEIREDDQVFEYSITSGTTIYNGGFDNAVNRRNTFRGKNLGASFTDEQKAAIRSGTFTGLYVGDYWLINNIKWRIVDINYWLGTGNKNCNVPHLLIMPDTSLYVFKMNDTNTTAGGYANSKMRLEGLEQAKSIINEAFGEAHILKHQEFLTNKVTNGHPSGIAWYESTVEIPNEIMMYGSNIQSSKNDGVYTTIDKSQLALMRLYPAYMNLTRSSYWLRDVVSDSNFAYIPVEGVAGFVAASISANVRPVFGLIG